jgi:hypothetical protein
MNILKLAGIAAFALLVSSGVASAEKRNFNFLSPAFGGNSANGSYLFGVAQAQLSATNRNPQATAGAGIGGGTATGGNIGGPTIVIPINTNQGNAPQVTTGATGTEAAVDQVAN